ncbi:hypothetical protein HPP92_006752 [Vanilla planifolia]|uniref:Uncharacterized protein n=1 Tax=Vanilla planifolia TaxID=51239 RepID=A0A835R8W7_VANPL|nr:hypothetical protein HPP92_006752 [Vanilla planifolia]
MNLSHVPIFSSNANTAQLRSKQDLLGAGSRRGSYLGPTLLQTITYPCPSQGPHCLPPQKLAITTSTALCKTHSWLFAEATLRSNTPWITSGSTTTSSSFKSATQTPYPRYPRCRARKQTWRL